MAYKNVEMIAVPAETKAEVREVKEDLGLTYKEFLERAADELTED